MLNQKGFTLIELIMIITIVSILAATVAVKWPTGLDDEAAIKEFIHAFRYAQHQAMTREYDPTLTTLQPWGMFISSNRYTIQRSGDATTAITLYTNRRLLDDASVSLTGPAQDILFNGRGEPIDTLGNVLTANSTYTVNGNPITVCPVTGYIARGGACP